MRSPDETIVADVLAGGGAMGALMRAFDWAATPLGPVSSWPESLRTVVGILLTTRHPMFLFWGPELIQFYNDGYRSSLGPDRHPSALGQRGRECWAEIWDTIGPQIEAVMERGEATWHEDRLVPITRGSRLQEIYWSYSYSPVRLEGGVVGGVLVTVQETTRRVLADRRQQALRELAARVQDARSGPEACAMAASVLARCPADLPFVRLFLREPGARRFELTGDAGTIPEGLAGTPVLDPAGSSGVWPIDGLLSEIGSLVINELARHVPSDRESGREPVRQAMLLPIRGEGREPGLDGVLVAGLSPHVALDQDYRDFLDAVARQVGWGVASAQAYQAAREHTEALGAELARLAALFEQAPGFLAVLRGPEHVFELVNPAYSRLVGHRQLLGKPVREALPEVEGQGFFELLDRVYRTGESFVGSELRMQIQPRPGAALEEAYFNFVYQAVRDAGGDVWGVLATGYDVTPQVRAREVAERLAAERDAERRQLLTVLAQSPVAIAIAEAPSGRVLYANPKVTEVFGPDVLADSIEAYSDRYQGIHPDGHRIAAEEWPLARAIRRGEIVELETVTVQHPDGRRTEISINAAPVRDAAGRITAGVALFQDVTDEHRRDQQLRDAQRLQSVGTLAGGIAHEINNQMTVVLSFSEFVLAALGPDTQEAADMRAVLEAGHRAARISQQLLAFTRRQISRPTDIVLPELIGELAPVLSRLLGADKTLAMLPPRSTRRVHADPSQLQQILINLVANARDATATGGHVSIAVEDVAHPGSTADERGFAIPAGDYVLLTVADDGQGMDAATLTRVFEPFYTTKPVGEGSGLGLSMVYGIVKQHGGYVLAESAPGRGTALKLYFPATGGEGAPPDRCERPAGTRGPGRGGAQQPAGRVLVVDDELGVRRLATRALEMEGYAVLAAPDGAAALQLLESRDDVDLVVTDVIMPHVNGRQLYDALGGIRPALPVLFISGHSADAAALRELVPPGAPFLPKPFTPSELTDAVTKLLGQRR